MQNKLQILIMFMCIIYVHADADDIDVNSYTDKKWKFYYRGDSDFLNSMRVHALDSLNYVFARNHASSFPSNCYIEVTQDYGDTWDTIYYEDKIHFEGWDNIEDVCYLDVNTIIAIKNKYRSPTSLLKTTDAGQTWSKYLFKDGDEEWSGRSLQCVDDTVFVDYSVRKFLYSVDGGESWTIDSIPYPEEYLKTYRTPSLKTKYLGNGKIVCFQQFKMIETPYMSGFPSYTKMFFSSDWGKNWELITEYNPGYVTSFEYKNDNIYARVEKVVLKECIFKQNEDGSIDTLKLAKTKFSTDIINIATHQKDTIPISDAMSKIQWADDYLFGINGAYLYYSSDYGITWNIFDSPLNKDTIYHVNDLAMANKYYGIVAIGDRYMRLENGTDVYEAPSYISNINLYPNPIRNETKLTVELNPIVNDYYDLYLIDIRGSRIQVCKNKYLRVGNERIDIPIQSTLSSGHYFLAFERNGVLLGLKSLIIQ